MENQQPFPFSTEDIDNQLNGVTPVMASPKDAARIVDAFLDSLWDQGDQDLDAIRCLFSVVDKAANAAS